MSLDLSYSYRDETLANSLQDLAVRFIINCPAADLRTTERLFFQIEEAHWYYEDFVRVENPSFPSMKMKTFAEKLFESCMVLATFSADVVGDLTKFVTYKKTIPVCGAIILDQDLTKILMVKGWKSGSGWGFPRGKINKDEPYDECAVREVFEEIGYDISPYLVKDDYEEVTLHGKRIRLYIVRGVPLDSVFEPQTRKEISKVEWFNVKSLPTYSGKAGDRNKKNGKRYFMVTPFVAGIKKYISRAKGLVTDLSKSESDALKNLLGVGKQNNQTNANILEIQNDKAASDLLSLLRPSNDIQKPEEKSDRQILLDLVNQGNKKSTEQDNLESARQILNLLRNEISEDQIQQPIFPSMHSMMPNIGSPFGFPAMPPPPMMYGQFPVGPGQFASGPAPLAPLAPPPPPPPGQTFQDNFDGLGNDGLEESSRPEYNAPHPPPPPNSVLLSLLQAKKNNANGGKTTESNISSSSLKLADVSPLSHTDKGVGGAALLSLLGGSTRSDVQVENHEPKPNHSKPGESLMKLLGSSIDRLVSEDEDDEQQFVSATPSPIGPPGGGGRPTSRTPSIGLLDMLKPATDQKSTSQLRGSELMGRQSPHVPSTLLRSTSSNDTGSLSREVTPPNGGLWNLLTPKSNAVGKQSPAVSRLGHRDSLLNLLGPGSPRRSPGTPPANTLESSKPSNNSIETNLMDLLKSPAAPAAGESKEIPTEQFRIFLNHFVSS